MKIREYETRAKAAAALMKPDGHDQTLDGYLMENVEVWSNAAALGYAVAALEDCGFERDVIHRVVSALYGRFDSMSVDEAEEYYTNW